MTVDVIPYAALAGLCFCVFYLFYLFAGDAKSHKNNRVPGVLLKGMPRTWEQLSARSQKAVTLYLNHIGRQHHDVGSLDQAPSVEIRPNGKDANHEFNHPAIRTLYRDQIEDHIESLQSLKMYEGVMSVVKLLDEHGNWPSVQECAWDKESQGWKENQTCYDHLKKITIAEHSVHVVEEMILEKQAKSEVGVQRGVLIVIGLGHDLGKIKNLQQAHGCKGKNTDHPIVSQRIMAKLLPETFPYYDQILEAIGMHHTYDQKHKGYAALLKIADQRARQKELKNLLPDTPLQSGDQDTPETDVKTQLPQQDEVDLKWLAIEKVLSMIGQELNKVDENGHYQGFTHDKTAYVQPPVVFNCIWKAANQQGRFDIGSYKASREGQNSVVRAFRGLIDQWVPSEIKREYVGKKYKMITANGKALAPGFYLSINYGAFGDQWDDIEQRKKGSSYTHTLLNSIDKVVAA